MALVGCGGGGSSPATSSAQHQSRANLRWASCPQSGWDASVAGLSCDSARRIISRHLLRYPPGTRTGNTAVAIRRSDPSTFRGAGFNCTAFPLEGGGGWHNVCDKGDRHISLYFTP
jgi:hypothetical protein